MPENRRRSTQTLLGPLWRRFACLGVRQKDERRLAKGTPGPAGCRYRMRRGTFPRHHGKEAEAKSCSRLPKLETPANVFPPGSLPPLPPSHDARPRQRMRDECNYRSNQQCAHSHHPRLSSPPLTSPTPRYWHEPIDGGTLAQSTLFDTPTASAGTPPTAAPSTPAPATARGRGPHIPTWTRDGEGDTAECAGRWVAGGSSGAGEHTMSVSVGFLAVAVLTWSKGADRRGWGPRHRTRNGACLGHVWERTRQDDGWCGGHLEAV